MPTGVSSRGGQVLCVDWERVRDAGRRVMKRRVEKEKCILVGDGGGFCWRSEIGGCPGWKGMLETVTVV